MKYVLAVTGASIRPETDHVSDDQDKVQDRVDAPVSVVPSTTAPPGIVSCYEGGRVGGVFVGEKTRISKLRLTAQFYSNPGVGPVWLRVCAPVT